MRSRIIGKLFQAVGIAALMVGFVQGVYGDMWGELYLFIGGIVAFVAGRQIEKRWERQHRINAPSPAPEGVDSK